MSTLVHYELRDGIALLRLDDGKANVMSLAMTQAIDAALTRAAAEASALVLTGRSGVFSGGFDLGVLRAGGENALAMLNAGFALSVRLAALELPVVIACTGHAMAMGCFLLQAGDVRIASAGAFKIGANEVAIGLPVPYTALELLRMRLLPSAYQRAPLIAEVMSPEAALAAGFVDQVVAADALADSAWRAAQGLAQLHRPSFVETQRRLRRESLLRLEQALRDDAADFARLLAVPQS